MKQRRQLAWAVIAAAIFASMPSFGAPARQGDTVRQGEAEQGQIKTQVQRATEDLTSIITELDRNGIGGEDVKILVKIRDILGDLTAKDMAAVIALLQEARNSVDPSQFRTGVTQAVVNQDQIIVKMKQLLLEYKRQQELYELSLHFTELAQRQNANLKEAKNLVRALGGNVSADRLNDLQKSSRQIQSGEQDAIRDETKGLTDKLSQMIGETDPDTADRLRKSLEQAKQGRLEDSLGAASSNLKDSKLYAAATAEKNARDKLYELAGLVAPVEDSATKLRKAAEKLDKAIAEQKVVIGQTGVLAPPKGDIASYQDSFYQVEDREGDNVDLVDRLRKAIDVIAPGVVEPLKGSQDKMQEARSALTTFHRDPAADKEQLALAKLEEARKLLEDQIAKADAEKPQGDALAQTKALKEKVAQLRLDQEKLNDQTKSAQPKDGSKLAKVEASYGQTARDLQIEAAPECMPAANEISSAGREMDRSRDSLDKASLADAQSPEKSAVDHLVRAEKLLEQQVTKLEQDQKDLAKLQDAREKVAKLIQEEQRVAVETAKQVGQEAAQKEDAANKSDQAKADEAKKNAETDKQLAQKQSDVTKKTDEARQSLPEAAKAAAQPLDSAKQDMSKAKGDLDQQKAEPAQPKEQQAIADLNKAKDAIDQKMSELQKELGQQPDNASKLDDLAKQLDQAQKDLNNTQQQMQQSPADQLAQKQQEIAQELKDQQAQNPNSQSLKDAQKSADQAAKDLQNNEVKKAVAEMKDVQTAIQQAQQQQSQDGQKGEKGEQQKSEQANAQKPGEQGEKSEKGEKGEQGKPGEQAKAGEGQKPGEGEQANAQKPGAEAGKKPGGQQGQKGGDGGTPGQSMSGISQQQAAVQKAAEQLATAQQQQQMQQAADQLAQTANKVTDAAANDQGSLPQAAQQALQQAEKSLNEATAQAKASNKQGAQQQTQSAQSAISQAQAAIDMAKQGMQPGQMASAQGQQPPPPSPTPGQQPSPSQGAPGAPSPGPGQANENTPGKQGTGDRKDTRANASANGARGNVNGNSTYLSLPARDRQAIQQGQKDKYPEEYGPAIEQYLKNLSDQESR